MFQRSVACIFYLVLLCTTVSKAQIVVNNNPPFNDPDYLIQNVLLTNGFGAIPNFPPPPTSTQIGFFDATNSNLGIDSGIVMVTATIEDVVPGMTGTNGVMGGTDPDLANVLTQIGSSSSSLNDIAVINFRFVAPGDSVQFRYIFASKEYPQYICSSFNDVFGFFLSGNDINGNPGYSTVNLATIPNTTIPVAINTVNQGFPGGSGTAANCLAANPSYVNHAVYYVANPTPTTVNMGGFTVPLTAKAAVQCGNIYDIKLIIADVSDQALNSAVFLEAKSFAVPQLSFDLSTNSTNSTDTVIYEGCGQARLRFNRTGSLSTPLVIHLNKSGTATEGTDYVTLPDSVIIPQDSTHVDLVINPIYDVQNEGIETIVINTPPATNPCFTYPSQTTTIYISDQRPYSPNLAITPDDTLSCPGDAVTISAIATGGMGQNVYTWDNGVVDSTQVVTPTVTTTYAVTVTDTCGQQSVTDSVTIYVVPSDLTLTTTDDVICEGEIASISATATGGAGDVAYLWDNGFTDSAITVSPAATRYYVVTVMDTCGVTLTDSSLVTVNPMPQAAFGYQILQELEAEFFNNSSGPITSYYWTFGDGSSSTDTTPVHRYDGPGTYPVRLVARTADGCVDSISINVEVLSNLYFYIPTAFSPNDDGINDFFEVKGVGFETYEIQIFNRWGQEVFHSKDYTESWDGNAPGGERAPDGVYVYRIVLKLPYSGKTHEKFGHFTMYR